MTAARFTLVVALALLGAEGARAAEPNGPADAAAAALDAWRLGEADAALAKLPAGETKELLTARLMLMRSDAVGAAQRLAPLVQAHPGEDGFEARVLYGRALQAQGKKAEAFAALDAMADVYNDNNVTTARGLAWLGVGLMLTDYPKNAHRVFREAVDKAPADPLAKRLWADLYASKYDYRKADPLYKAIGDDVMAKVGRARVAIESDRAFAEAVELMTPLVGPNGASPECVPCHNVLALVDLHNELPEQVVTRLEARSLKVAPADGEALALLGAAYYLMDDRARYAAVERRALAANPKAASFYVTVADHAEREHRYAEAVALLERALELDPDDWSALGMLGANYSRMGDDDKAKATLDKAFDGDPFNVRTYNLLAHFYDKADKRYTWLDVPASSPMRLRVDKDEAAMLGQVVPPLLAEAERALSKKYGAKPTPPLHVEVFKSTETFAVRSTGLPGLAAHGICFGHVITARSPSAGDFNWAEVLWHELAHVYHIQLTRGRVPRWFTEGLAVLESLEARPAWEREEDRDLLAALRGKKLRGVVDFNLAFTQAKSLDDILVAYYHAFQVTRFIRDTWGFPKMRRMLELWGAEKATPQVFEQALDVSTAEFDARFFAWLDARLAYLGKAYPFDQAAYRALDDARAADIARAADAPNASAADKGEAALLALSRGDKAAAKVLSDAALAGGGDVPRARYVRAMLRMGDKAALAGAKEDLEALDAAGLAGVDGLSALAALAFDAGDLAGAAARWKAAAALDPKRSWIFARWLETLVKAGDEAGAQAVRRRLAALEQTDVGLALEQLAALTKTAAAGDRDAVKADVATLAEQAMHIAPFSLEVHLGAARALAAVGLKKEARRAAELALVLDANNAEAAALAKP